MKSSGFGFSVACLYSTFGNGQFWLTQPSAFLYQELTWGEPQAMRVLRVHMALKASYVLALPSSPRRSLPEGRDSPRCNARRSGRR